MARIVYIKSNGQAESAWFAPADYVLGANEYEISGDRLPPLEELSDPPTLAQLQAAAIPQLDAAFEIAAAQLVAGYPPSERSTWYIQEREARAWTADNSAATPYVDQLAAARGIDRVDLIGKIMENVNLFAQYSAILVGKRQKWRDAIEAATDQAGVDAAVASALTDFAG